MRFRPCIDLHDGVVKQIVGSTLTDGSEGQGLVTNFTATQAPAEFAKMYAEQDLPGGHVIMLGGGNKAAALEALAAYPGGLQVGGGITDENAAEFIAAGASHVIVTSFVFRDGKLDTERLQKLMDSVGKEHLVLDLSCRKRVVEGAGPEAPAADAAATAAPAAAAGDSASPAHEFVVVTDRWQKWTDFVVNAGSLSTLAAYCDEFLVHGVDVEGKQCGVEEELVAVLGAHSPIPVTYAGGVRNMADIELVQRVGKGRVDVTVGSALDIFGGALPFEEVVKWHRSRAAGSA